MSRLKKKKIKILITGAAGFIGKYLVLNIKKKNNFKLILIDKKIKPNIELFKGLKYIRSNLCKNIDETLLKINPDIIIHLAALTSVTESEKNKKIYYLNNFIITKKICDYCKINNKKIIFASSAGIYKSKNISIKENDYKKPKNFYGKTKLISERYIIKKFNMKPSYIILRFFNVAGGNKKNKIKFSKDNFPVLKILTNKIIKNEKFLIYGKNPKNNLTAIRDYIHALDISEIIKHSIYHLINNKKNLILNCCTGKPTTMEKLINIFSKICKKEIQFEIVNKRKNEDFIFYGNNTKLVKAFNYKPKYNLEKIVKDSYESII